MKNITLEEELLLVKKDIENLRSFVTNEISMISELCDSIKHSLIENNLKIYSKKECSNCEGRGRVYVSPISDCGQCNHCKLCNGDGFVYFRIPGFQLKTIGD